MKTTAFALAVLVLAAPLRAQQEPQPKPGPTCPCDNPDFKPLNDKARAVAEYWGARRDFKATSTIAGIIALFGLAGRDGRTVVEAQNAFNSANEKLLTARDKAERLDGIKVTGGDDKTVELKLKKGVDYTLTP